MRAQPLAIIAWLLLSGCGTVPIAAQPSQPQSTELTLGEGTDTLYGTLNRPIGAEVDEPVLILAGSGPTDRNGNNPGGVSAQPYRLLADALGAQGISSLRVDKRGTAASAAAAVSEQAISIATYADDARAWAEKLRNVTGAQCVWLLGHSEGSVHALLAAQGNKQVCGLILVSPMGRKMGDVLREQLKANPANAPILDEALSIIGKLEAGQTVSAEGIHPGLMPLFRPSVQPFIISLMAVDPAALVRRYEGPILVVQGSTDIQTGVLDAKRLGAARPGVDVTIIDGMNHVLKSAPAARSGNLATYSEPDLPLASGLVDRIVDFVRR